MFPFSPYLLLSAEQRGFFELWHAALSRQWPLCAAVPPPVGRIMAILPRAALLPRIVLAWRWFGVALAVAIGLPVAFTSLTPPLVVVSLLVVLPPVPATGLLLMAPPVPVGLVVVMGLPLILVILFVFVFVPSRIILTCPLPAMLPFSTRCPLIVVFLACGSGSVAPFWVAVALVAGVINPFMLTPAPSTLVAVTIVCGFLPLIPAPVRTIIISTGTGTVVPLIAVPVVCWMGLWCSLTLLWPSSSARPAVLCPCPVIAGCEHFSAQVAGLLCCCACACCDATRRWKLMLAQCPAPASNKPGAGRAALKSNRQRHKIFLPVFPRSWRTTFPVWERPLHWVKLWLWFAGRWVWLLRPALTLGRRSRLRLQRVFSGPACPFTYFFRLCSCTGRKWFLRCFFCLLPRVIRPYYWGRMPGLVVWWHRCHCSSKRATAAVAKCYGDS